MSAITAAERTVQTELIRTRMRQLDPSPMATMEALLMIETMVFDGVLHADFLDGEVDDSTFEGGGGS